MTIPAAQLAQSATIHISSANDSKDITLTQLAAPAKNTTDTRILGLWQIIDNEAAFPNLNLGDMLTFTNDGTLKADDNNTGTTVNYKWFIQRDRISILDNNNNLVTNITINAPIDARKS